MQTTPGLLPMAWALVLFLVLTYSLGSTSQLVLTQRPSASFSPAETVRLPCSMSSGYSIDGSRVYWYQQKSGGVPRFLYHYYTSSDQGRGSGIPERFTASVSGSVGYLTITNVKADDEADYYCAKWYSSGNQYVFGGGTYLSILGQPETPPTVHLFPPSAEEKQSKNKATLVCLMDSFNPPDITVAWEADGTAVSNGVETTKPTKRNDKYIASSYLTLDASEYERHDRYTCKVTHKGTVYPKTVDRSECP